MFRTLRPGLLALVGISAFLAGCPNNNETPDAGPVEEEDAGGNTDVDAGPGDAGFRCAIDDDCLALARANPAWAGLRCDNDINVHGSLKDGGLPSFTCIPGSPCNSIGETNCQQLDDKDYCYLGIANGVGCRCVTEISLPDAGGVCMRRKPTCAECSISQECGDDPSYFDPKGFCEGLQGDTSGKKYCFPETNASGSCPNGMTVVASGGYCVPQSGSCENIGCFQDSDCPGGTVCNTERGLCERRCRWDFALKDTVPQCGPGKSCWVDEPYLVSSSAFFGSGRCKSTCTTNAECSYGGNFADGGQKLKCAGEQTAGTTSAARCRPNGECMDDLECPDPGSASPSKGYCDRDSFQCKADCRTGTDPLTGNAYSDCKVGYACRQQGSSNACVQLTCAELGGASIACNAGQLCSGEDRNGDGTPEQAPTGAVKNAIGCYPMPIPPWCQAPNGGCQSHDECSGYTDTPAGPNYTALRNLCVYGGDKQAQGDGINYCALASVNDFTIDQNGISRAGRFCPSNWFATPFEVRVSGQGSENYCDSDAECRKGNTTGVCGNYRTRPDGGFLKACMCSTAGSTDCPVQQDAGIYSFCKQGNFPSVCIESVVCTPTPGGIYKTIQQGGCGL